MATPTRERLVRFTILAYRREGITEEEFHHHWSKEPGNGLFYSNFGNCDFVLEGDNF
jgi:hypothetical protein